MKRVLLTGMAGFIGSHIVDEILTNTDWEIVGIASWQHKGLPQRLLQSRHYQDNKDRVKIITHDLNAPLNDWQIKEIGDVEYVINCASESHVDRSITDPVPFITNNVNLVLNVLELCRKINPQKIIQVSTDEVYGDAPEGVDHKEWSAIRPSNPYSASKAAQEAIAFSYWRTYSLPIIITNTMNNFGELQDFEKFFPKVIRKVLLGEKIEVHANKDRTKSGTRFYLHARNHANALVWILNNIDAQMYPDYNELTRLNVVGEKEISNEDMVKLIAGYVGIEPIYELVSFHEERPGHDLRYALDGEKIKSLGYTYPRSLEESMKKSVEWYLQNRGWLDLE